MPDPPISHVLTITAGSGTTQSEIIVENASKSFNESKPEYNKERKAADANRQAIIDLANLESGYSNGDTILIKAVGIRSGNAVYTVDTNLGGKSISLSQTSADYAIESLAL